MESRVMESRHGPAQSVPWKEVGKTTSSARGARTANAFRSVFMKTGTVSQANGSAYVEIGDTKVMCSVFGPRKTTRADEFKNECYLMCDFQYAAFSGKERSKADQDDEERELSAMLTDALSSCVQLEKYPKSIIDVNVVVLQEDGAGSCAAIVAASLALAAAGIEMYDLVAAASAGMSGNSVYLDPTLGEAAGYSGSVALACMPNLGLVTHLVQSGEVEKNASIEAIELCMDGCGKLYSLMRECLFADLRRDITK